MSQNGILVGVPYYNNCVYIAQPPPAVPYAYNMPVLTENYLNRTVNSFQCPTYANIIPGLPNYAKHNESMKSSKACINCGNTKWTCQKCLCDDNPIHINMCKICRSAQFPWLQMSQEEFVNSNWNYVVGCCRLEYKMFVDINFRPEYISIYYEPNQHPNNDTQWLRIRDTVPRNGFPWVLFRDRLELTDIKQGATGNCWFIAAICALIPHEHLIKRLFITSQLCEQGAYQIRLFQDGRWTTVLVDDLVPCDFVGYPHYSKGLRNQLWAPLLEKAAAKLYGCYEALESANPIEGLNMFTGFPTTSLSVLVSDHNRQKSKLDSIWSSLSKYWNKKYPMIASSHYKTAEDKGLLPTHSYAVLDVREVEKHRFIKLRDPSGATEWKNECFEDLNLLSSYMKSELLRDGSSTGVFWINFEQFTRHFSAVAICKLRTCWFEKTVFGSFPTYENQNPSFISFTVKKDTKIEFVLYQKNLRLLQETKRLYQDISLVILKRTEKPSLTNYELFDYPSGYRSIEPFTCYKQLFEAGQYVAIPLSFNGWHYKYDRTPEYLFYHLAFHSSTQIIVEKIKLPLSLRDVMIPLARTYGRMKHYSNRLIIYHLRKSFLGALVVAENYCHNWIELKCIPDSNCTNIASSRGNTLETIDSIPPSHCQVLAVYSQQDCKKTFLVSHTIDHRLIDCAEDFNLRNVPEIKKNVDMLHQPMPLIERFNKNAVFHYC